MSPHNEKVHLVVFGGGASFYFPIKAESKPVYSQKEGSHDGPRSCFCNYFWWSNTRYRHAWPGLDSIFLDGVGLSFLICFNINDYSRRLDHQRIAACSDGSEPNTANKLSMKTATETSQSLPERSKP